MIYAHIVLIFLGFVALVILEKESIERDNKLSKRIRKLNRQNQEIVSYINKNRGVVNEENKESKQVRGKKQFAGDIKA